MHLYAHIARRATGWAHKESLASSCRAAPRRSPLLPSPEPPVSNALPQPSPKALLSGMQNQPEVGFQQLGLIPFTPKAGHAPSTLPPAAVAQDCCLPHSLTSPPLPLERRNTTKAGEGGLSLVHCGTWLWWGELSRVEGQGGGQTESKPSAT